MAILLFTLFILSTLVFFYRLIFPDKAARLKFDTITKLGVAGYGMASVIKTITSCILTAIASQFLYFKNYYFYASFAGAIFFSITAVLLIFGYFFQFLMIEIASNFPCLQMNDRIPKLKKSDLSYYLRYFFGLFLLLHG